MRVLHRRSRARRSAVVAGATISAVAAALTPALGAVSGAAAHAAQGSSATTTSARPGTGPDEVPPDYDSRYDGPARTVLAARGARMAADPRAGVAALQNRLGVQGIVRLDPLTRTPRQVARTDGMLTAPSRRSPVRVALGYVRAHPGVFRLDAADLAGLRLRRDYVDVAGTHHLSFVQTVGGVPVFGNGLKAHVTRDGRLVEVDGSPVASLPSNLGSPRISAVRARSDAVSDVHGRSRASVVRRSSTAARLTRFSGGDQARLVVFETLNGPRLAWQTVTMTEGYLHVIDADTGRVLFRRDLTQSDTGLVWRNYPGAARGGSQQRVDLTRPGWLPRNSPALRGNVAHVFTDVNDDDAAQPSEEIRPRRATRFTFPLHRFTPTACVASAVCTWDPSTADSWRRNARQNAAQMLFFLSTWHDHLRKAPIGFTRRGRQLRGGRRRRRCRPTRWTEPTPRTACRTDSTSTTRT